MDLKMLARLGAVVLLGGAVIGAAIELSRDGKDREGRPARIAESELAEELWRCASLGTAAATDTACRTAWAENRRRFFGPPTRVPTSAPDVSGEKPLTPEKDQSRIRTKAPAPDPKIGFSATSVDEVD